MSHKPVTTAQAEGLRKIANEKQVGRALFQKALDDGSFAKFLNSLKADKATEYVPLSDARIEELTDLATKAGARIHVLRRIRIKQNREWQEAVNLAGPNTPDHYNVRKSEVSGQYQPASNKEIETDIVLLNYSKGDGNWDKGTAWGKEAKLNAANPREVFAIGEQKPDLHTILGQNPMYVVAPIECSFEGNRNACYVWWIESERGAFLSWVGHFDGASRGWFAFRE
jgi:hypothetical protein